MAKKLKTELHHWWPRSLSKFWADADGCVTQLSWEAKAVPSEPAKFGAITNAHLMKYGGDEGSPWDTNFEPDFGRADSAFPDLVEWLLRLDSKVGCASAAFHDRFLAQPIPQERRDRLAACIASLIVRSPCTRESIKTTAEYYRKRIPLVNYEANKTLIATNMRGGLQNAERGLQQGGKLAVLFSDSAEFICGEGFLHNFEPSLTWHHRARCCVPLTPEITVAFVRPPSCLAEPEMVTLRLSDPEVHWLNDIIQIYSRSFVFYRKDEPRLLDDFRCRQFQVLKDHADQWLDGLFDSMAEYSPDSKRG